MRPNEVTPSRFVVVVRRGTFGSLREAAKYAAEIGQHDVHTVLSVEIEPTLLQRGSLYGSRAE